MSDKIREDFEAWFAKTYPVGNLERNTEEVLRKMIAEQAWVASREQAYTAIDMTTAAAEGFRDGVASKSEPCDGCFMAEAEDLRKDAELGRVAIRYIDRLCDPAECDPLETIVEEYVTAFSAATSKESKD